MKGGSIFLLILVAILAYVFYKKFSELSLGLAHSGEGKGPGGDASSDEDLGGKDTGSVKTETTPAASHKSAMAAAANKATAQKRPAIKLPNATHAPLALPDLLSLFKPAALSAKIEPSKLPYDAQTQAAAKRLAAANKDAAKFQGVKFGTTAQINQSLAEMKNFNDVDFGKVYKVWQILDHFSDPLTTPLAGANISNSERSNFLTRLVRLGLTN